MLHNQQTTGKKHKIESQKYEETALKTLNSVLN